MRHGETEYNTQKRYQGWRDIPLSEKGRAELVRADFSPAVVYISPLVRAEQTAQELFPDAELRVIEGLKEMRFGVFEGRSYIDMEHDPDYIAWIGSDGLVKIPGGESKAEFCRRTCATVAELIDKALAAGEKQLVIMAHGGTQMAVMEQYAMPKKDYYDWCGPNAGGYICAVDPAQWAEKRLIQYLRTVQYTEDASC